MLCITLHTQAVRAERRGYLWAKLTFIFFLLPTVRWPRKSGIFDVVCLYLSLLIGFESNKITKIPACNVFLENYQSTVSCIILVWLSHQQNIIIVLIENVMLTTSNMVTMVNIVVRWDIIGILSGLMSIIIQCVIEALLRLTFHLSCPGSSIRIFDTLLQIIMKFKQVSLWFIKSRCLCCLSGYDQSMMRRRWSVVKFYLKACSAQNNF